MRFTPLLLTLLTAAGLTACGSSNDGPSDNIPARGALVTNPPDQVSVTLPGVGTVKSLEPDVFKAVLDTAGMTQATGVPKCTVTLYDMEYGTVGGAGEKTNTTGAIMVPSGDDPACSGPRPVVLYAHGTSYDKNYNFAQITTYTEGMLAAGMYAAQGFIVVAPNYAGYRSSRLDYHPYLYAEQSANDMVDALRAARKAFEKIDVKEADKLFITGYSQGGHVAMATQRAMQETYASEFKVTALAGMSGPYAMTLLGDGTFLGVPNLGATIFFPMISTSWQKSYGGLYSSPSEMYEDQYASGIETLLPSTSPDTIFSSGKLPQLALFAADAQPNHELIPGSFGPDNLIKTSFHDTYLADVQANPCNLDLADPLNCAPKNPFRQSGKKNDLRTYVPNVPVLLCGGNGDPTVFWDSSLYTSAYFKANGMPAQALQVLDVDSAVTGPNDPFAPVKLGFAALKASTAEAAGGGAAGVVAVTTAYHGSLVPPFCNIAARGFFQTVGGL